MGPDDDLTGISVEELQKEYRNAQERLQECAVKLEEPKGQIDKVYETFPNAKRYTELLTPPGPLSSEHRAELDQFKKTYMTQDEYAALDAVFQIQDEMEPDVELMIEVERLQKLIQLEALRAWHRSRYRT